MAKYKNIDDLVGDATIGVMFAPSTQPIDYSEIPSIGDEVSLDTNENYSMMVEVSQVSEDKQTFCGIVKHGYYPREEAEWINVGDLVEFSRKKIGGIFKK